ncbi:MAG TPA: hypothetical protein VH540_24805 [Ktedonobacterales bacterium]|jgi:hypothetical protein
MAKLYDYRTQEYREMKKQAEMQGAKEGKQCRCNEGTWCMQATQAAHNYTKDDALIEVFGRAYRRTHLHKQG